MKNISWKRRLGFTLAEVLIVVGIIGIIAESTIPSLISDFQDKVVVSQVKSDFSILTQTFNAIKTDEGELQNWCSPYSQYNTWQKASLCAGDLFSKKLKVLKNCGTGTGTDCLPSTGYQFLFDNDGSYGYDTQFSMNMYYKMLLVNGSTIIVSAFPDAVSNGIYDLDIYVDVNGPKKPNRYGYDFFRFIVYSPLFWPQYSGSDFPRVIAPLGLYRQGALASTGDCNRDDDVYTGDGCASWVLYNSNLDYKYVSDLTWETKTHK